MTAEQVERAEYDVIEELGDRVEIRQYGEMTLISTVANDSDSAFRVLAGYIFGKNRQKTTISMTAPVIILPGQGSIDMSFVLPQGYDMHSAPEPESSGILIHEMPPRKVATITFSGYVRGPGFTNNRAKLEEKLNEKGIKKKGEYFLMMYDPPWTPPDIKRNEVAIEVEIVPERYRRSLFVFRRDLRIDDNTALMEALNRSDEVIPCFIFDPRLSGKSKKNFNNNAFQFMVESLDDLRKQFKEKNGRMYFLSGLPEEVIGKLIRKMHIDAVFVNADYTPFSRKRDEAVSNACSVSGATFHRFHDSLLHEPGSVLTKKGTPYVVFTQFFRASSKIEVPLPVMAQGMHGVQGGNFYTGKLDMADTDIPANMKIPKNEQIFVRGGRSNALAVLEDLAAFKNYDQDRDFPSLRGTTGLSAHNKFGTMSIREFYHSVRDELGAGHTLINELHWRDFFTHIASEFPHVFKSAFKQKYDGIRWDNSPGPFRAWCSGKTGYPIVDAGMRELNTTGFMHNRVRMITASFLVKDLHIDWRLGERYFASRLVDYDPCVNNGNWQWSASTGADAQPFFRIFNPWIQQEKYDPDCEYIRKWLPELDTLDAASIHKLEKQPPPEDVDYPPPIVDHAKERNRSLVMFRSMG